MKTILRGALVLFLVMLLNMLTLGCDNPLNSDSTNDEKSNPTNTSDDISDVLSANLDGAKAFVTRSTEESRFVSKSSRSGGNSPLVKILEDGSIEDVFQA